MIKKLLISILIRLIGKDLFDYSDIDFEDYYMTYLRVHSRTPEFVELKKRQLGRLHITAAMELDQYTKMMWIGQILLLKKEIENLEHASEKIEEFQNKPHHYKQMKKIYNNGREYLKLLIKHKK